MACLIPSALQVGVYRAAAIGTMTPGNTPGVYHALLPSIAMLPWCQAASVLEQNANALCPLLIHYVYYDFNRANMSEGWGKIEINFHEQTVKASHICYMSHG